MARGQKVLMWVVALLIIGGCGIVAITTYQGVTGGLNATLTSVFATADYVLTDTSP